MTRPARAARRRHRFLNGKKTASEGERDPRGRFTGAVPGPGRPFGTPNKATPLRESFSSVFGKLGGEAMLLRIARRYPRDFLTMMIRLEPRLIEGDLDLDVAVHNPGVVKVVLPFNHRASIELLGDRIHQETPTEQALRLIDGAAHNLHAALAHAGKAAEARERRRWFSEMMTAARAALAREQAHVAGEAGGDDDG